MGGQRGSDGVVLAIRIWAICAGTAEQHELSVRDAKLGHCWVASPGAAIGL